MALDACDGTGKAGEDEDPHLRVMLTAGIAGGPHNNPTMTLRRMDDDGAFV